MDRRRRWSPVPPPGALRVLAAATLTNTIGSGLWSAGSALYLTRVVGLPVATVGAGLTAAGMVGLLASVPAGRLVDRWDPRRLRATLQVLQACAVAGFLLVDTSLAFVLVAVVDALLATASLSVRAGLIAAVAGPAGRVHAFASLRAVASVGIGVGAGLAAFALAADTATGYRVLVAGNSVTYLVSAVLVMRLPVMSAPAAGPESSDGGAPVGPGAGPALPPWRDWPYVAVSGASAALALHEVVLVLILPLWIAAETGAPTAVISAVLVVNAVLTVGFAVRASHGASGTVACAAMMVRAALVLAVALLLFAAASGLPSGPGAALLVATAVIYTVGDLWHANAGAALAYDLAPSSAIGAYQGVHGLARAAGPALLTWLLLGGRTGWIALAALFALIGLTVPLLVGRASWGTP